MAAGKSAREALDIAVEKSGEMIRDAADHEYTKAATAKVKDMAIASATELQKMAVRGVNATRGVIEDHSTSDPSSAQDIENAIHKLKGGDKVGQAGEVMGVVGGAVAGASAAVEEQPATAAKAVNADQQTSRWTSRRFGVGMRQNSRTRWRGGDHPHYPTIRGRSDGAYPLCTDRPG